MQPGRASNAASQDATAARAAAAAVASLEAELARRVSTAARAKM
tara:strand:+ start:654 stop:785 length:132 start_codon:yes stop_codon:yes gene_type:complete